ncbi:MAG: TRAP transporter small permease subunit [Pseudomonadota bacterium]|nr:TRAP transporter small permease subunit [Pseudomonadota bacterium]
MVYDQPVWVRWIVRINLLIGGLAIAAMLLHIIIDVTARHLFNVPVQGTLEIVSFYYMVGLVYLAIPLVQARSDHIFVELFTVNAPPKRQDLMDAVIRIFSAVLLLFFAWVTTQEALHQSSIRAVVEAGTDTVPVWPTRWLIPLSMVSTAILCLWQSAYLFRHAGERHGAPREESNVV